MDMPGLITQAKRPHTKASTKVTEKKELCSERITKRSGIPHPGHYFAVSGCFLHGSGCFLADSVHFTLWSIQGIFWFFAFLLR
jgi:hypothetical protein